MDEVQGLNEVCSAQGCHTAWQVELVRDGNDNLLDEPERVCAYHAAQVIEMRNRLRKPKRS